MPARLIEALSTTAPLAQIFSDESVLQAMLDFEVALAKAEARVGMIPQSAARAIAAAARTEAFDLPALSRDTFRAGTPGIPIVEALTEAVRREDASAAGFVHWGATSQDVADTALVLLLKQSRPILAKDLATLTTALRRLSERHKNTIMLGRTLLQAAPPITFGLKVSGWLSAIERSRRNLDQAFSEATVLQFGGATGTLAALDKQGPAIARALADELGLTCPEAPWHTQRDRLASLVCAFGVLTGSLGKMARDISLLMQNEIAEASEPGKHGRGGSSTMPHKHNPIACALTLAAATRVPYLVAAFLSAMPQEHERGVGGWQAEWPIIASIVQSTGVATSSMAEAGGGLKVNAAHTRTNLKATNGLVFAERAMMMLAPTIGRDEAHKLIESAAKTCANEGMRLAEVLAQMPEVTKLIDSRTLRKLESPQEYLGSAEEFLRAQTASRARSERRKASSARRKGKLAEKKER